MDNIIVMEISLIQNKIYEVRGFKVMLDYDLAVLYGVETKRLNEAVKRNSERFPADLCSDLLKKNGILSGRNLRPHLSKKTVNHKFIKSLKI